MARTSLIQAIRRAALSNTSPPTEEANEPVEAAPIVVPAHDAFKRPGFGLPFAVYTEHKEWFPSAVGTWESNTLTVRERAMLAFVNRITDKPGWERKVFDEEIVGRWKAEMEGIVASGVAPFNCGFSDKMYDYCIKELRDKARIYERSGIVSVLDAAAAVFKSDVIVPEELKVELRTAVAPLEDVPEEDKDWHPGSDGKVLDLVHPSLWPLVYGKTRIRHDRQITLDEALGAIGSGEVITCDYVKPERERWVRYDRPARLLSDKFQWLPAEVEFTPEGRHRFVSYINNLHPDRHRELYDVLERLLDKAMPMLHATYDRVVTFAGHVHSQTFGDPANVLHRNRIVCLNSNRDCNVEGCIDCDKHSYPPLRASLSAHVDGEHDSDDENVPDEDTLYEDAEEWFENTHPVRQPEPKDYKYVGYEGYKLSGPWFTNDDGSPARLQVIVKLANIHLTPEQPSYDGGSWHIEGQLNERICATALYYYDSDNVVDTRLAFRTTADAESMEEIFSYEQDDHRPFWDVYGQPDADDSKIQLHGDVVTREGRLLVFPNVYQHQVAPFALADPSKPGHRKIVALFLVDPATPVISTANVPPQQQHWETTTTDALSSRGLPVEISQLITRQLSCPYPLEEALKIREQLIDERKSLDTATNQTLEYGDWNFCEH